MANLLERINEYRNERKHIREKLRLDNPDFW
jgi:hypothetical protein